MEATFKEFELQIDEKSNGAVIRLNDENGCKLRICAIPKEMVYNSDGSIKEFIDITFSKPCQSNNV